MLRNLRITARDGGSCVFEIHGSTGLANAVRRAVMTDVARYAPSEVLIRKNTSAQNDEFIAHRIGQIPFLRDDGDEASELTLRVCGREADSNDFAGKGFHAPPGLPIVLLGAGHVLDLSVRFCKATGAEHARFSLAGPVAYRVDGAVATLGFATITGESALGYLRDALLALQGKLRRAEVFVEAEYDARRRLITDKKK